MTDDRRQINLRSNTHGCELMNHFQHKGNQFNRFGLDSITTIFLPQIRTTPSLNHLQFNLDHKHNLLHQSTPFLHHAEKEYNHGDTQDSQLQRRYALDVMEKWAASFRELLTPHIKFFHNLAGYPDPCQSNLAQNLLEAIKRICALVGKKKHPVTPEHLQQIYKKINGFQSNFKRFENVAHISPIFYRFFTF